MLLGDVLARFDDEAFATETLMGLGDLALVTGLREQAAARGQSLGDFAASTVRQFAAHASDERWVTLMGAMARAEDPARVCLKQALAFALEDAERH